MRTKTRRKIPAVVWLILLYAISVAAHYEALKAQTRFPLLATDEAQYAAVGENLRLGHGFMARGEFHAGLPPLYPLFVAFALSLGSDPRLSLLFFSCLAISLALFPAYGLARDIGAGELSACVLAAAAAFLPNTVYAGLYMTETLSYPLFLMAFWMCARWLERPSIRSGLIAGVLLAAMMLTKVAAFSFAAAVLATVLILSFVPRGKDRTFQRPGVSALWMFGVAVLSQALWQAFKFAHRAGGLGVYGHVVGDNGLHGLSARLLIAYLADFLLAPGLIAAVPLFLWFRENYRRRFALSVLLGTTLAFQITIHGVLEAGLTGFLRERLYMYSLPLMAIFAAKGIEALPRAGRFARILFVAAPLALLGLLALYRFPYIPVLDIPWASAVGSPLSATVEHFAKARLFILASALVIAAACGLLWLSGRRRPAAFAAFVLVFESVAFASSAKKMDTLSEMAYIPPARMVNWLTAHNVNAGDRLIVCGELAYYQERHRSTPMDAFFAEWHQRFDLTQFRVFEIETMGRYDVRIAASPDQITELMRPGDRLLTATRMSGLKLIAVQHPYYLYTLTGGSAKDIRPLYTVDITAELSYGWPLITAPEKQLRIMLGQPLNLPAGQYRADFYLKASPSDRLAAEVVGEQNQAVFARREGTAANITPLVFSTRGDMPLRFRLAGPDMHDAALEDVVVSFTGPFDGPKEPYPPTGAVTQTRAAGLEPELYASCGPISVNGAAQAPLFAIRRGDTIDIQGWTSLQRADDGLKVQFHSTAKGDFWLPAVRSDRNQYGIVSFRAVTNSASFPDGRYRVRPVQIENGKETACAEFWNLAITAGADVAGPAESLLH